jgi:hypothetical protein
MGFSFKKYKDRRSPLIEREDIVALRVFYLWLLRRNETSEKRSAVYFVEIWIHTQYAGKKCYQT